MMYSFGWQMLVATPPIVIHGLMIVCPPFTLVPVSSATSCKHNQRKCSEPHVYDRHISGDAQNDKQ